MKGHVKTKLANDRPQTSTNSPSFVIEGPNKLMRAIVHKEEQFDRARDGLLELV